MIEKTLVERYDMNACKTLGVRYVFCERLNNIEHNGAILLYLVL